MTEIDYKIAIDYYAKSGDFLRSLPVEPDFQPARECVHFLGIRRDALPATMRDGWGEIEPVWDERLGTPTLRGVRVRVRVHADANGKELSTELDLSYFEALVSEGTETLIASGHLARGDEYSYRICAHAVEANPAPEVDDWGVEEVAKPLPLVAGPHEAFLADSTPHPSAVGAADDASVFIPQVLLDDVEQRAREADLVETGGILVGHLRRDTSDPHDLFVEVTAQIPAKHATATGASLTFTPETWTSVRAALALRKRGELTLGWWHSHPWFCRNCNEESRKHCALSQSWFSGQDIQLHRTCFQRSYQLGLLVSNHGQPEMDTALFGWRNGRVKSRGFHVLPTQRTPETEARST